MILMNITLDKFLQRVQKWNIILFGVLGIQMFLLPFISGFHYLEYFPPGGIFLILCASWLVSTRYYSHFIGKFLFLITSILTIFLTIYWFTLFSGPFDRLLQIFMIFSFSINVFALLSSILLPILKLLHEKKGVLAQWSVVISPKRNSTLKTKRIGIIIAAFFIGSFIFTPLAVYDFGRTYVLQAPDDATTRSSFWGPPVYDIETITQSITPMNNETLIIQNGSLTSPVPHLRSGAIMYVEEVTHSSTPGENYCDYLNGAESYPNGSVFLSAELPTLTGVTIKFRMMNNSKIFEYLSQLNSRILHTEWGGNQSWTDSPKVFDNVEKTWEYLMMEYWNISYYINIHVSGYVFPNIYNHSPFIARATEILDWISVSTPYLNHCLGIVFDFEPKEVLPPEMNPDRPEMPPYRDNPFVSEDKWHRLNEQNDEVLNDAKTDFFNLFDHAEDLGLGVYATFVNYGMEDLSDGDLDITRLPVWKHPNVEYGMMSYQSKREINEARWRIYTMNKNQQNFYGEQGYTLLTGWLTYDEEVHLPYYTNDEAGLNRYLHDIKLHQACGAREVFHSPLQGLIQKWGADVVLQFNKSLNTDPKEEFVFNAYPWGYLDTTLYDIAENYNDFWIALPTLIAQLLVIIPTKYYKTLISLIKTKRK